MSLSIIVPTLGRPTLYATLISILDQLDTRDEVIVVGDKTNGELDDTRRLIVNLRDNRLRYSEIPNPRKDVGYTQRRYGMLLAQGSHLAFMDDDDVYVPGALNVMRQSASGRPVLFQISHPLLGTIWNRQAVEYGNLSSQMILVPNAPEGLGEWEPHTRGRGGDFTFIRGCIDLMGDPHWVPQVIAELSPAGAQRGSHVLGALTV